MSKDLTIMLLDDNKIDLFIHGEVIKRIPFVTKIQQFTFAGDALVYLNENDANNWPDVILLDIYMPIMNGFDFLAKYKQLSPLSRSKCKVVMVSSSLDSEDLKKAKTNAEVFSFLEKPMNSDKLTALLQTAFPN